jgi:hypothetical protein
MAELCFVLLWGPHRLKNNSRYESGVHIFQKQKIDKTIFHLILPGHGGLRRGSSSPDLPRASHPSLEGGLGKQVPRPSQLWLPTQAQHWS